MPFQPAPNIVKVEAQFTLDGQQIENVWHVHYPADLVDSDLVNIAGIFNTQISGELMPLMSEALVFYQVQVTDLSVEDGRQYTLATTPPQPGAVGSDSLPNNSAFVVTLNTGRSGRGQTGRNYYSGLPDTAANRSHLNPTTLGDLVTFMNDIITALEAVGFYLALLHRVVNKVVLAQATWDRVVTASARDDVMDSQRRRLPGRGK